MLVVFDLTFYVIIVIIIGMSRIVHVHHVDKDAFLKGNMEPDPDEVDLVFERSPTYAEVLKQVRIELNWMDPSDVVELEGRHNAGHGVHLRWKFLRINSELRWVAYKETVAESLDKSIELFATKKVDAHMELDLNQCDTIFNGRSPPIMNQDEVIEPPSSQHEVRETLRQDEALRTNDEHGDDGYDDDADGVDLHDNNVGDLDTYLEQESMDHYIPYS